MKIIKWYIYHHIKKENNIPLSFYQNTFNEIKNELSNIFDKDSLNIFAIDGTYSNTNINRKKGKIQTSLNMGYYDIKNNIPIDITFNIGVA